jgi:hypothetical protein
MNELDCYWQKTLFTRTSRQKFVPIQFPIQRAMGLFAGGKRWGAVKFSTHLYLVPKYRICGALPSYFIIVVLKWINCMQN